MIYIHKGLNMRIRINVYQGAYFCGVYELRFRDNIYYWSFMGYYHENIARIQTLDNNYELEFKPEHINGTGTTRAL